MTFQSPFDDFVLNSLAPIPGLLDKLDYVASLRQGDGSYCHWGLARVHGESAAQQAASEAHRQLFTRILSTPLAHLLDDVTHSQKGLSLGVKEYLGYLTQRLPALAPPGAGDGPRLHFNSVLHAVSALARAQSHTSPPAS